MRNEELNCELHPQKWTLAKMQKNENENRGRKLHSDRYKSHF